LYVLDAIGSLPSLAWIPRLDLIVALMVEITALWKKNKKY